MLWYAPWLQVLPVSVHDKERVYFVFLLEVFNGYLSLRLRLCTIRNDEYSFIITFWKVVIWKNSFTCFALLLNLLECFDFICKFMNIRWYFYRQIVCRPFQICAFIHWSKFAISNVWADFVSPLQNSTNQVVLMYDLNFQILFRVHLKNVSFW